MDVIMGDIPAAVRLGMASVYTLSYLGDRPTDDKQQLLTHVINIDSQCTSLLVSQSLIALPFVDI